MGQIKNIKLHIVTDIKKNQQHSSFTNTRHLAVNHPANIPITNTYYFCEAK